MVGLWHLGSVTAACLAEAGYEVIGVDPDASWSSRSCAEGRPPVSEPGLAELFAVRLARLRFSADPSALAGARCAWVTFDTPVDDEDQADVEWVLDAAPRMLLAPLADGALVIVSSQLPVGSVAALQRALRGAGAASESLRFACVPENLRLGSALESFRAPDRIVAGVSSEGGPARAGRAACAVRRDVEWMRVESAEMTKHALNGFLATSVAFINEVAAICESVGADAGEVSRGLKSERRIGPRAYLGPGDAFAGGTLARDISLPARSRRAPRAAGDVFAGVAERQRRAQELGRAQARRAAGRTSQRAPGALAGATVGGLGLDLQAGHRHAAALERGRAVPLAGRSRARRCVRTTRP